jgi:hypothetical protein
MAGLDEIAAGSKREGRCFLATATTTLWTPNPSRGAKQNDTENRCDEWPRRGEETGGNDAGEENKKTERECPPRSSR